MEDGPRLYVQSVLQGPSQRRKTLLLSQPPEQKAPDWISERPHVMGPMRSTPRSDRHAVELAPLSVVSAEASSDAPAPSHRDLAAPSPSIVPDVGSAPCVMAAVALAG